MRFPRFLLPLVGALVLVAPGVHAVDGATDASLAAAVKAKLAAADPRIVQRIEIDAQGGVVTLKGIALTPSEVLRALENARRVPGVTKVVNRMVIRQ
jgi:osmotically-inducible protein OsmY